MSCLCSKHSYRGFEPVFLHTTPPYVLLLSLAWSRLPRAIATLPPFLYVLLQLQFLRWALTRVTRTLLPRPNPPILSDVMSDVSYVSDAGLV